MGVAHLRECPLIWKCMKIMIESEWHNLKMYISVICLYFFISQWIIPFKLSPLLPLLVLVMFNEFFWCCCGGILTSKFPSSPPPLPTFPELEPWIRFISFIVAGLPMATIVESELLFPPPFFGRFDLADVIVTSGGDADAASEAGFPFF